MELLKVTELTKTFFKKGRKVTAVNRVSFSLQEKEFLAIVGESGSGKSSLLRLIAGLDRPDAGELFYRGDPYTGKKCSDIGHFLQMVFQDACSSFDPKMKMLDSVRECRGSGSQEELGQLLKWTGLEAGLLRKRPGELSGGQCQRMSIVRALYSGAEILLCDEITSALDVTTQAQIVRVFQQLREERTFSAIFVSHDIALMGMLCERIMVMKDGVCVEEGKTKDVISHPVHDYTKLLIENAAKQSF